MTSFYPFEDPYAGYPPPPPSAPPSHSGKRGRILGAGVAGLVAGALVTGLVVANVDSGSTVAGSGSVGQLAPAAPGNGGSVNPGQLIPGNLNGGNAASSASIATSAQKKGVVTIVSVLRYQNAESAGTGVILTSDGEVLTNNHVINGATSVTVRVASTGRSYRADVVGTDPTDDVAVLRLRNASGLATANLASSANVSVGDPVVGVGNAGGTGTLRASSGKVTALNQSITATDGNGQDAERLTGLIETNAPIVSGDSGGPLYNASGEVVGIDTAASLRHSADTETAYAIPIDNALKVATQIESGLETSRIHIGLPAFLGVGLDAQVTSSATVESPLNGGPAAAAGITSGSVITKVDGTHITTAASLRTVLRTHQPGDKVTVHWTDAAGQAHAATVTLIAGPAD